MYHIKGVHGAEKGEWSESEREREVKNEQKGGFVSEEKMMFLALLQSCGKRYAFVKK